MQEKVGDFFARLSTRREEVKRRCRTVLQAQVEELMASNQTDLQHPATSNLPELQISPWLQFRRRTSPLL